MEVNKINSPEQLEIYLLDNGYDVISVDKSCIKFWFKFYPVTFYFKKQWATGKTIQDGRGIEHLLNEIKV